MKRILLLILLSSTLTSVTARAQVERRGLRLIVVSTEAKASALRAQILAGESFEVLAREHSTDGSAAAGGYMGTFAPGDLRQEFQAALSGLKPGETSAVTRFGNEFALLQFLTEEEESWRVQSNQGLQALQQQRYAEAAQSFSAAVLAAEKFGATDDRFLQSLSGLAEAYRVQEKYAEAEPVYRRILAVRWAVSDVLESFASLVSLAYFRDGQFEEALKKYEQAISRAPLSEDLYVAMNNILSGAELRAEAETLMLRAVRTFPNSRRVRYRLAELYRDSGRMKKALDIFKEASEMEGPPGLDPVLDRLQRSFVYQRMGGINTDLVQFDAALAAYKKALEINPDNAEARLALADLYLRRDRLDEALAEYTRVVTANPRSAAAHSRLAELNLRMARFPESVAAAAKALEIDPAHRRSRYVRAMALIRMGESEEGQKELQEYEKLERDAQAETNQGREIVVTNRGAAAHLMNGRAEEAIAMFRKGIEAHPKAAGIYVNLGLAQSRLGRHRDAVKTFETVIDLGFGDNFLVHRSLSREYELLGDTKASLRHQVLYLQRIYAALEAGLN